MERSGVVKTETLLPSFAYHNQKIIPFYNFISLTGKSLERDLCLPVGLGSTLHHARESNSTCGEAGAAKHQSETRFAPESTMISA